MIKANDIRIGNFLSHKGKMAPVECIDSKGGDQIERVVLGSPVDSLVHNDVELAPIPVTDDLLMKFGFEILGSSPRGEWDFIKKGNYLNHFRIRLERNDTFTYNTGMAEIDIRYVHQLQNLYHALTGEELVIR